MKPNYFFLLLLAFCFGANGLKAQNNPQAEIKGVVLDAKSKEPVPFANISLFLKGESVARASTVSDLDGNYSIKVKSQAYFSLSCNFVGYASFTVDSLFLEGDKTLHFNIELQEESELLDELVILYDAPLIDKTKSSKVVNSQLIERVAVRDISMVSGRPAGVRQEARGKTTYFIDGIKVNGSVNLEEHKNGEVLGAEEYANLPENKFLSTKINPLSTFSSDVDVASYANVRRYLKDGYLPPAEAVRIEEMINYFSYQAGELKGDESFAVKHQLVTCPWEEKHQLLRISINTQAIEKEMLPPNNLVFLIDVSGSMNSDDKLGLLQKSLKLLVNQMREEDRISIVVYASNTGVVLEPTAGDNKKEILRAINGLHASGSTAGGAGIELAYALAEKNFKKNQNNRVILATDGDFNVGVSSEGALTKLIEQKRESGVFLSVLGFGTGNYMDAKMEALADNGNGNYAYIDNLLEAKKVLVEEMGANLHVVAKDTKFQIEFNPAAVSSYRLIGYENRILAAEDFNDDKKDAGDIGAGHYVSALYEIVPQGSGNPDEALVDDLKYSNTQEKGGAFADELATLKIRHKKPSESKSSLLSVIIPKELEELDADFSFMAGVASFGMILRNSDYRGNSNYKLALSLAEAGMKAENTDYRSEFIQLLELAQELDQGDM